MQRLILQLILINIIKIYNSNLMLHKHKSYFQHLEGKNVIKFEDLEYTSLNFWRSN